MPHRLPVPMAPPASSPSTHSRIAGGGISLGDGLVLIALIDVLGLVVLSPGAAAA